MPRKQMMGARRRRRRVVGGGFFGDVWDGIKSVGRKAGRFLKDNKVLSKVLSAIPHPYAQTGSKVASALGLGRRRRRVGGGRKRAGGRAKVVLFS